MTNGFTCISHRVWETPMEKDERYMLLFLLECENNFNRMDDWFYLTDEDFINAGFGKNKSRWKKHRDSLIEKGWLEYEKGVSNAKSKYKLIRNLKQIQKC